MVGGEIIGTGTRFRVSQSELNGDGEGLISAAGAGGKLGSLGGCSWRRILCRVWRRIGIHSCWSSVPEVLDGPF